MCCWCIFVVFLCSIDETALIDRARADVSVIATARNASSSASSSSSSSSDGDADALLLRFARLGPSFDAWTSTAALPADGPLRTEARALQSELDALVQMPPALPSIRYREKERERSRSHNTEICRIFFSNSHLHLSPEEQK